MSLAGCGRISPERSAQVKITTAAGRLLYVNRLARGVTYDVMWISVSDGMCRTPSVGKDVVLTGQAGYPLYYQLRPDGSLLLFLQGRVDVPNGFPIVVNQEDIHPMDWRGVEKRFASGEVQRISLDLPTSDECLIRW
jgi:hypothetical protein